VNTQFAIVVSTATKAIRRIIMPHADIQLTNGTHGVAAGETMLIFPVPANAIAYTPDKWPGLVQQATGVLPPPSPTCALIDAGNIVRGVICADPALDSAPSGFTMVACYSPQIGVGFSYNPVTGLFSSPTVTLPANSRGNPSALPVVIQPVVVPKS
jgi:hypothetical protein